VKSDFLSAECCPVTAEDVLSAGSKGQNIPSGNGASSFSGIRSGRKVSWSAAFSPIPIAVTRTLSLSQLETSGPKSRYWVAVIVFANLRSLTRYGRLVLGKLDHFTAPVASYRLRFFREEISNVKFDHFRHEVVPEFMNMSSLRRLT
jgi:hypothetical protein